MLAGTKLTGTKLTGTKLTGTMLAWTIRWRVQSWWVQCVVGYNVGGYNPGGYKVDVILSKDLSSLPLPGICAHFHEEKIGKWPSIQHYFIQHIGLKVHFVLLCEFVSVTCEVTTLSP